MQPAPQNRQSRNLLLRVVSSAVLAPVAIGIAYLGGWPFAIFWTAAAIAVWWEWTRLVHPAGHQGALVTGICALVIQALLLMNDRADVAMMIAALGALGAAIISARNAVWTAAGVVYASLLMIAPVMIRGDDRIGFFAILFVFAVVWGDRHRRLFHRPGDRRAEARAVHQPEQDLVGRDRRHDRRDPGRRRGDASVERSGVRC